MNIFMVNNKTLFILLISCIVGAKEFPKLCPSEQNMPEICEQLRQISPNQTLVFEDGFTMNTCALKTVSHQEVKLREVEKKVIYEIEKLIANRYPKKKNQMAEAFRNPARGKTIYPDLSDAFDRLINIRESIGVYTEIAVTPFSLNSEVKFAADSVRSLSENKAKGDNLSELSHLLGIIDMARSSDVKVLSPKFNCRPEVNAFYSFDSKKITMLGMAYFPPPSRVAIFGHEVGHSIETCHFTNYREKKPKIFADLEACIRNDLGFVSTIDKKLNCDRHTAEAFCDHIGVHVLEDYLKANPLKKVDPNSIKIEPKVIMPSGYQNIMVFLDLACSDNAISTHPAGDKRLLEIMMRSPEIAKSMKCPVDSSKPRCSASQGAVNAAQSSNSTPQAEKPALPTKSGTQR